MSNSDAAGEMGQNALLAEVPTEEDLPASVGPGLYRLVKLGPYEAYLRCISPEGVREGMDQEEIGRENAKLVSKLAKLLEEASPEDEVLWDSWRSIGFDPVGRGRISDHTGRVDPDGFLRRIRIFLGREGFKMTLWHCLGRPVLEPAQPSRAARFQKALSFQEEPPSGTEQRLIREAYEILILRARIKRLWKPCLEEDKELMVRWGINSLRECGISYWRLHNHEEARAYMQRWRIPPGFVADESLQSITDLGSLFRASDGALIFPVALKPYLVPVDRVSWRGDNDEGASPDSGDVPFVDVSIDLGFPREYVLGWFKYLWPRWRQKKPRGPAGPCRVLREKIGPHSVHVESAVPFVHLGIYEHATWGQLEPLLRESLKRLQTRAFMEEAATPFPPDKTQGLEDLYWYFRVRKEVPADAIVRVILKQDELWGPLQEMPPCYLGRAREYLRETYAGVDGDEEERRRLAEHFLMKGLTLRETPHSFFGWFVFGVPLHGNGGRKAASDKVGGAIDALAQVINVTPDEVRAELGCG
jgi:hypothetical protein